MPKKNKLDPQVIETRIASKSFASLDKEINKVIAQNKKDQPVENLFGSSLDQGPVWGSGGPPHMVLGRIVNP
jgi:hypothetical protein